ncbi:MAG: hypothetical protein GY694_09250 [Gammaproteobacteria bacterium]|nr:hypothetical protein [Gammaproteobacteria bacterium]
MAKKEKIVSEEMIAEEVRQFCQQQKTLMLASSSPDNAQPLVSYAPFIEEGGDFFLFLSGLASHSHNLKNHQIKNNLLSVLLIEDEQSSRNLFARKRLNYSCTVSIWSREHPQFQEILNKMEEHLGKTISVLSGLGDFNLYCLTPVDGNYVRGFGQAYELRDAKYPVLTTQ